MKHQRGFGGITIGLAVAAVVTIGIMGIALRIQTNNLDTCRKDNAVQAIAIIEWEAKSKIQNQKVDEWEATAKLAEADAAKQLEKALRTRANAAAQISRLRGLATRNLDNPIGTCADAVVAVKRSLVP